jgi:hypothetical protein
VDGSHSYTRYFVDVRSGNYLSSYDMANFHEMVINNICKMVGRPTVGLQDNLVIVKDVFAIILGRRKVDITT